MKLYASALIALTLVSCGKSEDSQQKQSAPSSKVTDQQELNKLSAEPIAQNVLVRIPVSKDGTRDYSKAEAVNMSQSVDMNDPNAVHAAFSANQGSQGIALQSVATDGLDESSTQQFHGRHHHCNGCGGGHPIPRVRGYILPWRRNVANALYYGTGNSGYYHPYNYQNSCVMPLPQPVCYNNCGSFQQQQSYSYEYQSYQSQSSSNWYNATPNYGSGIYGGGFNGGGYNGMPY